MVNPKILLLYFIFLANNNIVNGWSSECEVNLCMSFMAQFYISENTTVATIRKFEFMDDKRNISGIRAGGKYGEKCIQESAFINTSLPVLCYREPQLTNMICSLKCVPNLTVRKFN
jgi:hypothetical protein